MQDLVLLQQKPGFYQELSRAWVEDGGWVMLKDEVHWQQRKDSHSVHLHFP